MKYYLIAGEASGDLHASQLMKALQDRDPKAQFRFFGGAMMENVGGEMVCNYKQLAYMGFIPVLLHLPSILQGMQNCKKDILNWKPDVVILIDYPGFNLSIAKYLNTHSQIPVVYYISPKIWAWKEYRIKSIKKYIDKLYSILPFEVEYFHNRHSYEVEYVGNPTVEEIKNFNESYDQSYESFCNEHGLDKDRKIVAILAGSRYQEIRDNLPSMLQAIEEMEVSQNRQEHIELQYVIAGAPSIPLEYYNQFIIGHNQINVVSNATYPLLHHSFAALVTSGTATLETCIFNVPQVVCYKTPVPSICRWGFNHILKCRFISLVNLISDKEIVQELFADRFTISNIKKELQSIIFDSKYRNLMLHNYSIVAKSLGIKSPAETTAENITSLINNNRIR